MGIIELQDITFIRESRHILDGLNWSIGRGQHWALLGANGSGKTTLLRVVTGYEWPSTGDVRVLGEHFGECDLRELRKLIGWVSSAMLHQFPLHQTALDVAVSGFDASIGLYRDIAESEWHAARNALQRMGIAELVDRPYRILSQGEQQRVLLARALVHRPALLVLDEPCGGLDPAAREGFLAALDGLARGPDAPTTVLVTHHLEEIGPWIDHVLVLKAGRVLAAGAKARVLRPEVLSEAFGGSCRVEQSGQRYYLRFDGIEA